jgi:CRP-like cAMP-binding protein
MADHDLSRPDGSFELPLTQKELGTALGLTSVHVNRVLQKLRAESLVEFIGGVVRIRALDRLEGLANFDPAYLSP